MSARELSAETVIERLRKMADLLDQLDRLRSAGLDRWDFGAPPQTPQRPAADAAAPRR